MSAINGMSAFGVNPSQILPRANDRFEPADTDGNSAVSKSEFKDVIGDKGIGQGRMEKLFSRIDSNGDGGVSLQEREDMLSKMQQRMSSLTENAIGSGANSPKGFDSVQSLLQSLHEQSTSEGEKQRLQNALDKMRTVDIGLDVLSDSLGIINDLVPKIDTSA